MNDICSALKNGATVRHRDWPPYHYARLRCAGEGRVELCRFYPDGHTELLLVSPGDLNADRGWSILDPRSYD